MATNLSETEFFDRAREFLRTELGRDTSTLQPEQDLLGAGVLDSLLLLSFLYFLERMRGDHVAEVPDFASGFSLRSAYALIRS